MGNNWLFKFISPSRIDNYLKYLSGYEWKFGDNFKEFTTEAFIDKLLGIEEPSHHLEFGTAFHKIFEDGGYGEQPNPIVKNGVTFTFSKDFELYYPPIREMPVSKVIGNVLINGTTDSIDANTVHDLKTSKQFDYEYYSSSVQWQTYLMLTGLSEFIYHVFVCDKDEFNKTVIVKDYHQIKLSRYVGMESYVTNIVNDYFECLLNFEPLIIARMNEYNNQISEFIEQLKSSQIVTAKHEINDLINKLQSKYLTKEKQHVKNYKSK